MSISVTNPFLTVKELAKRWRRSELTIRRFAYRGELKVVRIGRAVMIPAAEVERIEREGLSLA